MPQARLLSRSAGVAMLAGIVVVTAGAIVAGLPTGTQDRSEDAQRVGEIDPAQEGFRLLQHKAVVLRAPACVRVPAAGRAVMSYEISNVTSAPQGYRISATANGVRAGALPKRIALRPDETTEFTVALTADGSRRSAAFIQVNAVNLRDASDARTASTEVAIGRARTC